LLLHLLLRLLRLLRNFIQQGLPARSKRLLLPRVRAMCPCAKLGQSFPLGHEHVELV